MATKTMSTKDYQDLFENIEQTTLIAPLDVPAYDNNLVYEATQLVNNSTRNGNLHIDRPNLFSLFYWAFIQKKGRFSEGLAQIQPLQAPNTTSNTVNRLTVKQKFETKPHLEAVQWIKNATGLNQERIGRLIGVTRQTIDGWKKKGTPISDINRRRLFAVREVLERAASKHKTKELLVAWLDTPRGTDGRTPAQLLEDNEINRVRFLAMSSPSSRLVHAPSWIKQPIPEAFRTGAEHRQEAVPPDPFFGKYNVEDEDD